MPPPRKRPTTNSEVRTLLHETAANLRRVYPFPSGSDVDDRFALSIGVILGLISRTLWAESEDQALDIDVRFKFEPKSR